ncbi:MAG TPA: tripartite tricarboxylate transporter substrate binding protein, partial [Burkholderiales bacterium]|nr:tripartite tricarboxylate transporter substrate binding protein [Burkholderiales bacterium]
NVAGRNVQLSVLLAAAALLHVSVVPYAGAQAYPVKPIRYIVPLPPGGGTDLVARAIAQRLAESGGIKVVIDNRPGGNTVIGAELAARSAPDGYTIFMGTNTTHAISPNLNPKLPYDPVKDFAAVTKIALLTNLLVVHPSLPVRSVKELVALAKSRPGQLNFASTGTGTPPHLAGIMFNEAAGTAMAHVPYKGGGPATVATVSGETQLMFGSVPATLPHVRSGRVRPIAVTSLARSTILPQIPTVAESGYPGFEANTWFALFAPAGTPSVLVDRINAEFAKVIGTAEFKAWLTQQGAEAVTSTPDELAAFVKAELALYARLVKKSGMRAD